MIKQEIDAGKPSAYIAFEDNELLLDIFSNAHFETEDGARDGRFRYASVIFSCLKYLGVPEGNFKIAFVKPDSDKFGPYLVYSLTE